MRNTVLYFAAEVCMRFKLPTVCRQYEKHGEKTVTAAVNVSLETTDGAARLEDETSRDTV